MEAKILCLQINTEANLNNYYKHNKHIDDSEHELMGNKQNKIKQNQNILPELPQMYTEISSQPDSISHPQLPAVKKYTILLNKHQKEEYEKQLKFRQQHRQQLIQIMYGEVLQDKKDYLKAKVYVEQMVLNLQQLQNLHFLDMMAIFHKVFRGFKILYQNFGPFTPDPRMICFNEEAVVKVWANIKYSRPKPKASYQMMNEKLMVESLTQIFMNKVDLETVQIDSRRRRFNFNAETFDESIKIIESQVDSTQLIPTSINAIKMLLISGRKILPDQIISMSSEFYSQKLQKTIKFNYSKERQNSLGKITDTNRKNPKVNFSFGRKDQKGQTPINRSQSLVKFQHNENSVEKEGVSSITSASMKVSPRKVNIFLKSPSRSTERDTEAQSQIQSQNIKNTEEKKPLVKFTYTQ